MRSILVLLIVLFFGALAQAQLPTAKKVEVVETAKATMVILKTNSADFNNPESTKELSLIYKRRLSVVKKHLFFTVRKNVVKTA